MPVSADRQTTDAAARFHTQRSRAQAKPRLEVLETRCLMSGWGARLDPFAGRSHATAIAVSKRDRIAPEVRAAPRNTAVEPVVVKTSAGSPASIEHATSDEVDL